jgi:thiamine transport system substrate-binding protein
VVRKFLPVFIPLLLLILIYVYLYKNNNPQQKNSTLVVYTYSSFASSWGPGPELKKLFFEKTHKTVEFVDAGEAGIIIQRVLLEKNNPKADIVLGLDQFQITASETKSLFEKLPPLNLNLDPSAPQGKIMMDPFVAYNWAPMTFIYRKSDNNILPKKLMDFASPDFKGKIVLIDPGTSTAGFIFFHWVLQKLGEKETLAFFDKLKKTTFSVTPSWSAGYGLFKKKQSQYVFSYLTSPIYHWIEEKDLDYVPLYLEEELPYHIEYVGILSSSPNQSDAQEFLKFLFEPEAQKIIMSYNFMLPVVAGVKDATVFDKLKPVKLFEPEAPMSSQDVLSVWRKIQW